MLEQQMASAIVYIKSFCFVLKKLLVQKVIEIRYAQFPCDKLNYLMLGMRNFSGILFLTDALWTKCNLIRNCLLINYSIPRSRAFLNDENSCLSTAQLLSQKGEKENTYQCFKVPTLLMQKRSKKFETFTYLTQKFRAIL